MIRIYKETNRIPTSRMNNTDIGLLTDILMSDEFVSFIKSIRKSNYDNDLQVSVDIAQAVNEMTRNMLASPINDDTHIAVEVNGDVNVYTNNNKPFDIKSGAIQINPSDSYYDILHFIEDLYIDEINNK